MRDTACAAAEVQRHAGGCRIPEAEWEERGCDDERHAQADTAVLAGSQLNHVVDARVLPEDDHVRERIQSSDCGSRVGGHVRGDVQQGIRQAHCRRRYDVEPVGQRRDVVRVGAVEEGLDAEAGVLAEAGKARGEGGNECHIDMGGRRRHHAPPGHHVGQELSHQLQSGHGRIQELGERHACMQGRAGG